MKKAFQVGGVLVCLAFFGGCQPKVATEEDSTFQGADLEAQMKAMIDVGEGEETAATPGNDDAPEEGAAPKEEKK